VSDQSGNTQIYVAAADGSNRKLLFDHPGYADFRPRFSPDGTKIVFGTQKSASGLDFHIAMSSADGTGYKQLTTGAGQYAQAAWIDNETLIFSGRKSDSERWSLYRLDILPEGLIGTKPILVEGIYDYRNPAWTR
jgi:Tol biopolymer transport system component